MALAALALKLPRDDHENAAEERTNQTGNDERGNVVHARSQAIPALGAV
jgi:hypothetical protein